MKWALIILQSLSAAKGNVEPLEASNGNIMTTI